MAADTTGEVLAAYYDSWRGGRDAFDAARLRSLLADDLEFEGSIAGRRRGADGFVQGLGRFVESLRGLTMLEEVREGDRAAFLYDCEVGTGTLRFAEFIRVESGRIRAIKIHYNADQYRALGAR